MPPDRNDSFLYLRHPSYWIASEEVPGERCVNVDTANCGNALELRRNRTQGIKRPRNAP
jgi:hypothetical protein